MVDVLTHESKLSIPAFKPTSEDEKLIRDPMAYLVIKSPFFAYILYQECIIGYSHDIPIAATDGKGLYFNPAEIRSKNMEIAEIAFIVAHEVAHVFLGDLAMMAKWNEAGTVDCGPVYGVLPYDHQLMNCAQDYRINAMLIEAGIGKMPRMGGLYDPSISAKGMESAPEIYGKLFKKGGSKGPGKKPGDQPGVPGNKPGGGGGKPAQDHGSFDQHLPVPPEQVKAVENGRMKQVVASAALAAESSGQGTIPGAIKKMIGDILEPKVSWQDHLKSTIIRGVGDPQYDWRTIDRRLIVRPDPIYFAKQAHTGCGEIAIGYDTSGSCISDKVQQRFFSEMNAILADLNPQKMWVMWCDAKVQRVDELEDTEDLTELHHEINQLGGAPGGGGTSFTPVFREIDQEGIEPELLIYLTDGHGSFPPHEPPYQVVWAIMKGGNVNVPFGTVVEVEL